MGPLVTISKFRHGTYQCSTASLDLMISRYLPASPAELSELINEREGRPDNFYRCATVTEALLILAELDGLATN